jgi:putative PIN family toxin of toxin-antitoxin system
MRVVIDTNVLVSGMINPYGPPGRIVEAGLAETFTVLYDDRVLSEYRAVLHRPMFGFHAADIDAVLAFVEASGEPVRCERLPVVLPDASDLPFLEVAVGGQADALITGNVRDFKPRRGSHEVNVCTPAEFIRLSTC